MTNVRHCGPVKRESAKASAKSVTSALQTND